MATVDRGRVMGALFLPLVPRCNPAVVLPTFVLLALAVVMASAAVDRARDPDPGERRPIDAFVLAALGLVAAAVLWNRWAGRC